MIRSKQKYRQAQINRQQDAPKNPQKSGTPKPTAPKKAAGKKQTAKAKDTKPEQVISEPSTAETPAPSIGAGE